MSMKPEDVRSISLYFILPITIISLVKSIQSFIEYKKNGTCIDCYEGIDYNALAVIVSLVYLVMMFLDVGKSWRVWVFYLSLLYSIMGLIALVRVLINKALKSMGQTAVTIGADAAAKVAVESGRKSTSVTEAKVIGGASGAKAAGEAAKRAGLSEDETIEAVVAGQVTGEAVAEKVATMSDKM